MDAFFKKVHTCKHNFIIWKAGVNNQTFLNPLASTQKSPASQIQGEVQIPLLVKLFWKTGSRQEGKTPVSPVSSSFLSSIPFLPQYKDKLRNSICYLIPALRVWPTDQKRQDYRAAPQNHRPLLQISGRPRTPETEYTSPQYVSEYRVTATKDAQPIFIS